eukprot:CAMPEP_0194273574 /NCGR_PEP_ID=MMETSP0169-20130528/6884_1 /TAXON_ID=218684 /ORGANISM="Corethron pennatum, Strain L29A3" /LENGTH=328 /DNA_ID=CAMNT_0039016565 /DNA_START=152 /DNA_END=1138 /DNA_ORIENTATION=-
MRHSQALLNATDTFITIGAVDGRRQGCSIGDNGVDTIPPGTLDIAAYEFYYCPLKSLIIPKSVTAIGYGAFFKSGIEELIFEAGSQLETTGMYAFRDCESLRSLTLPKSLTTMGSGTFYSSGLEEVIFEAGSQLAVISGSAFYECAALTSISIPKAVTALGYGSFANSGLETLFFEADSLLETIGQYAFAYSDLRCINIPVNVVTDNFAFRGTGCDKKVFVPGEDICNCERCSSIPSYMTTSEPTKFKLTITPSSLSSHVQTKTASPSSPRTVKPTMLKTLKTYNKKSKKTKKTIKLTKKQKGNENQPNRIPSSIPTAKPTKPKPTGR